MNLLCPYVATVALHWEILHVPIPCRVQCQVICRPNEINKTILIIRAEERRCCVMLNTHIWEGSAILNNTTELNEPPQFGPIDQTSCFPPTIKNIVTPRRRVGSFMPSPTKAQMKDIIHILQVHYRIMNKNQKAWVQHTWDQIVEEFLENTKKFFFNRYIINGLFRYMSLLLCYSCPKETFSKMWIIDSGVNQQQDLFLKFVFLIYFCPNNKKTAILDGYTTTITEQKVAFF